MVVLQAGSQVIAAEGLVAGTNLKNRDENLDLIMQGHVFPVIMVAEKMVAITSLQRIDALNGRIFSVESSCL